MGIAVGTRLGPYEILAPIGAGGMGEVYRARDTKLKRDVALKVLPEAVASDPERMARFQREAEVLASLNHPNIAHIYGVEDPALVMELVEGASPKGPMSFDDAWKIASQIASALEYAHDKGIVHRDLKPANVKITPDGVVKLLDFGLAKAFTTPRETPADVEQSPTLTIGATEVGVILGTAAYMSPEQAKGKNVDKRADIWAFGVVLYELLTGERLFRGQDVSETLAQVLTKQPDLGRVPAQARRLLRRCLEKNPKLRLRDIGETHFLLEHAPVETRQARPLPWAIAVGVMTLIAVSGLFGWYRAARPKEPAPQPLVRLDLDLGPDVSLGSTTGPAVVLSPDGTRLVFVSQGSDRIPRLFTRLLDQPKAIPLAKTEGAYAPFFSPDGQWVGFFAQGKLKKTRVDGGEPISLCDAPAGRGASWGEDGNIVAALDTQTFLSQVPSEGGKAITLTNFDLRESTHRWPQVLPGGKAVLFNASIATGNFDEAGIAVVSLTDHRRKTLLEHAGMFPRYLPSGHLVYVTKGTLFAIPFDLERLEVRGAPTLLEAVSMNPTLGFGQLDFSRSGTLAYRSGGAEGLRTIQWLDGAGKTVALGNEPAFYIYPHLSPDGGRLAYIASEGSSSDLWIFDLKRGSKTRLTTGLVAVNPVWSPDGRFVVFQSPGGTFWTRADGAGNPQSLMQSKTMQQPGSFTPDGTRLAFTELTPEGGSQIRTVSVESGSSQMRAGEPQVFLKTSTVNNFAAFSPDGRWLAYADAESGSFEVFVRAFPDNGAKVQISNAGGMMPMWSRNGQELFYRTEDQRIMVANYTVQRESFAADKPRVWFAKQLANLGTALNLDLAPDGKRFIVLMPAESPEPRETQSHVTLVVNYFDEVRRRAPVRTK